MLDAATLLGRRRLLLCLPRCHRPTHSPAARDAAFAAAAAHYKNKHTSTPVSYSVVDDDFLFLLNQLVFLKIIPDALPVAQPTVSKH